MTQIENTYNQYTVGQLGMDWDEYQQMMSGHNQRDLENDRFEYDDPEIQRTLRNWEPEEPQETEVNTTEYWEGNGRV